MTTLTVRLGTMDDANKRLIEADRRFEAGELVEADHSINFASYDNMHKVLAPSRLAIAKALSGQGALSHLNATRASFQIV
jgi:predicted transcriptional regulator